MKIYQALFFLFCHMVGIGYGQPSFLLPAHCGPNKKGFVTKSLTGVGSLVPTWIWDLNIQRRQQLSLSKQLSFLGGLEYCIKKEFGCSEKLFFFFYSISNSFWATLQSRDQIPLWAHLPWNLVSRWLFTLSWDHKYAESQGTDKIVEGKNYSCGKNTQAEANTQKLPIENHLDDSSHFKNRSVYPLLLSYGE